MTFLDMLGDAARHHGSMLCVGLDPEPTKFPARYKGDANKIYDFCAAIVDATADLVVAFKPQIAYFAAHRAEGQLERLMEHMRRVAPRVPIILDAKRGDIGSTAEQYAIEAFERFKADQHFASAAETVSARCSMCHAAEPVWEGIISAPKGVVLDSDNAIAMHAREIYLQAARSHAMPPGNITEITPEERRLLVAWYESAVTK